MINILFVDDEPKILEGLQRMLRSMRHEWEMSFACGGAEALTTLAAKPFDVVVSDMRMPGMNGAQLLQEVRSQYPHIVRIILSGYAEEELVVKSIGIAHQYVAKPCDSELLKTTVSRACTLKDLLSNEKLRSLVSQLHTVPSLPTLYSELARELHSSDPSLRKVGEIIKQDLGMTVRILQMVNSAFFGLRRQVSDASEAVNFLGLDMITSLTLAVGVFSQFEGQLTTRQAIADLWAHSSAVGTLAKKIAVKERAETASDAFTAGLLHDIGEVVLAVNLPQQFAAVQNLIAHEGLSKLAAERQIFAATHAEIGAYLLGLWGLPSQVVEAVAFHHTPSVYQADSFTAITAVHVANALHRTMNDPAETLQKFCDVNYLTKLGLLEKLPLWQATWANLFEITASNNS